LSRFGFSWMLGIDERILGYDGIILWDHAKGLCAGIWVMSKSWCTVMFYGGIIGLFGPSILAMLISISILDGVTIFIGYLIVKRWCGVCSAIIFSISLAFSPFFIHKIQFSSEHLYGFFFMMSLLMFTFAYESIFKQSKVRMFFYSVMAGCCMWFTTWSRGEGILLWIIVPAFMIVLCFIGKIRWRASWVMISTLYLMGTLGAFVGYTINVNTNGTQTVFCSNDNLWPRLFGAKFETNGEYNNDDVPLLWHRYLEDCSNAKSLPENYEVLTIEKFHGGQGNVPKEAVKYIKEEIALRWRNMNLWKKITFIKRKFSNDWLQEDCFVFQENEPLDIIKLGLVAVFPTFFSCSSFLFFLSVFRRKYEPYLLSWCVLLCIIGNIGLLTLAESSSRYGWLLYQIWGIYGAVFVGSIILGRDATRLNSCGSPNA
ncbi:MAG: hypothetical protein RSD41_03490, partial [Kiritimatiellia bacterium]